MDGREKIYIRTSIGTLALLKKESIRMFEKPYTAYILQYSDKGCSGNCIFCIQSRVNSGLRKDMLARISWPKIELREFLHFLEKKGKRLFKRICIQSVIKNEFIDEIIYIVKKFEELGLDIPVSVAITPVDKDILYKLRSLGVDRIGVGLDAASPRIFKLVGKPYTWNKYIDFIKDSLDVFGYRRVVVHLIAGLGEREQELYRVMENLISLGADIALFAHTPLPKLKSYPLGRPSIEYYRRAQIVRTLLLKGYRLNEIFYVRENRLCFREDIVDEVREAIDLYMLSTLTSGCPWCNRPYYNESPRGPFYNIPSTKMLENLKNTIAKEVLEAISKCIGLNQ